MKLHTRIVGLYLSKCPCSCNTDVSVEEIIAYQCGVSGILTVIFTQRLKIRGNECCHYHP